MDSFDSAGLPSGSRLLSQSPQFSFASASSSLHTGPGGDDLSLSELYPDNHRVLEVERECETRHNAKTRPSIAEALGFGAAPLDRSDDQSMLGAIEDVGEEEEEGDGGGGEADVTVRGRTEDGGVEDADRTSIAAQSHEEKLQNDLFVLRQLNGALAVYNDALREAQTGTEVNSSCGSNLYLSNHATSPPLRYRKRIAEQLEQTDALLNQYINILSKTEQVSRLVFDERWMGAEAVRLWLLVSIFAFFETCFFFLLFRLFRTRRNSRRRNACGKRRGGARRRSVSGWRSENGSGRRRKSSSVRCAIKRCGSRARSEAGRVRAPPVAACGASAGRVHLCARVPLRRGAARGQVRAIPPYCAFLFFFGPAEMMSRCCSVGLVDCCRRSYYKGTEWAARGSLENRKTVVGCILSTGGD